MSTIRRLLAACGVAIGAYTGVTHCSHPTGPTTQAQVCQGFDSLGQKVLNSNGIIDNPVFDQAGTLAGLASRFHGPIDLSADASRLHSIAGSDSTSGLELMNATEHIAELCGHPLAVGGGSDG